MQEDLPDVRGEELEVRGERVRLPTVAGLVALDVAGESGGGAGEEREAHDRRGPPQQPVQIGVVRALLLDVEGAGHAQHRGVHVDLALRAEGLGDLGRGPVAVEAEAAAAAEELGVSLTDRTDFTPTPKRPI
ncbi:hypothetical protein ACU4GG_31135 [Streptomyces nojiriensis]